MGRIFAIGDIHGCFDKLRALLNKIDINFNRDTLLFLGDYVDRGKDSFKTVEYLIALKQKIADIVFLKGNHELMLLNYMAGFDRLMYLANGGQQTIDSYVGQFKEKDRFIVPDDHLEFFNTLKLYYETDTHIFVHAGLKNKVPLKEQRTDDLLWIRSNFIKSNYDFGKMVIFGHTPFRKPFVDKNKIGIDTGAVYGNKLTCLELPEYNFYSV